MRDLDVNPFGPGQPCFGCSQDHPFGFHLKFAVDEDAGEVVTRFVPDARYQGPPGLMHGGLVTTLADEVAAWVIIGMLGKFGFTAAIDGKLRKPIRIGEEVEGRGRIVREGSRTVRVSVKLTQAEQVCFTGEFDFVLVDQSGAERLLGGPLPEAWKRFCR